VIARTAVPVLLIRSGLTGRGLHSTPSRPRLLVTLDGSTMAEKALPVAADLARVIKAELSLVRIIQSFPASTTSESSQTDRLKSRNVTDPNYRIAESYLDAIAKRLRADGVRVLTTVANN